MTTATAIADVPPASCVVIKRGPLAGVAGRRVTQYRRRWIIEMLPGVLVSVDAASCEEISADAASAATTEV